MKRGFTIIELVVVVTLLVILTAVYFLSANPAGQLASVRNTERISHLQTIMNAVRQNLADQSNQQFLCSSGPLPTSTARMTSVAGAGKYNIAPCLVPTYLFVMPFDPTATSGHYTSVSDYDTGYTIAINASGVITIAAPYAELGKTIVVSR